MSHPNEVQMVKRGEASGLVVITPKEQDLIHAIRSGLSKLLDRAAADRNRN